jgi:hypothetical protein
MVTPLLAQDDTDQGPPSLGGGLNSVNIADRQRSPLEVLIERSSEEARSRGGFVLHHGTLEDEEEGLRIPNGLNDEDDDDDDNFGNSNGGANRLPYSPYITLSAGMFCLLQIGLVWGSFLSASWFDTHLLLTVELPVVKKETDQVIHSTTLASLLSNLLGSDPPQHWAATSLMITSLVVPCLACVCGPMWTYFDRKDALGEEMAAVIGMNGRQRSYHRLRHSTCWEVVSPRMFVEYSLRVSFVAFFLLIIITLGTSSMEINSNSTRIMVNNRIRGGLASYALGMTCASIVLLILRAAKPTKDIPRSRTEETNEFPELTVSGSRLPSAMAPPHQAFQFSWSLADNNRTDNNVLYFGSTSADEEGLQAPLIASSADGVEETRQIPEQQVQGIGALPFWKKAVVYESGAMATLLWLPALFLPLFHLTYDGIISDFMTEVSLSVRLWEFPAVLWQRCETSGTEKWIMISLGTVLIGLVYVGPILATILCIATWTITDEFASAFCRRVLGTIQPILCGLVFCLALHLALPAFEAVSEYAIDMGSSGLCQKFQIITSDTCLRIQGQGGLGLIFLFAQSLALEVLVILTLVLKKPL